MANEENQENPNPVAQFEQNTNDATKEESLQNQSEEPLNTQQSDDNVATIPQADPEIKEYQKEIKSLQKTKPKWLKILLIVIVILLLIVIVFIGLYFSGMLEKNEKDANTTKKPLPTQELNITKKPSYRFSPDHIRHDRLNKKLAFLTKYELSPEELNRTYNDANTTIYDKEIVYLSALEEKLKDANETNASLTTKISKPMNNAQEQNVIEATANNQNKKVSSKPQNTKMRSQNTTNKTMPKKTETVKTTHQKQQSKNTPLNKKQKYVQVVTLKYSMYKGFLDKVKEVDARISVCKDAQNRTQVFIGPFTSEANRKSVIKQINEKKLVNDAFGVEFTQAELDQRCNF